jgi:selenide,water dikinase
MPIVGDPFDFGAIAATNAISDVYAMGGRAALRARAGGHADRQAACGDNQTHPRRRRISVQARRHSVDSVEAIHGLVAIGLVNPRHVKRNSDARPGDTIILGKALGVDLYGAAVKKQPITDAQYRELIASSTQLNTPGVHLAQLPGVHALTDVTGFGLLGHLLEVCRGSGVRARIRWSSVPLLTDARALASAEFVTGGSARNWMGYGSLVDLTTHCAVEQAILTDPQTSAGARSSRALPGLLTRSSTAFAAKAFNAPR